jgi:maleylpyruvate isomerase
MNTTRPDAWIDGCTQAHAALLADLAGLSDAQARQPSLLPGWSVGHLLTHIARNADSVVRRLEGAIRGEVLTQYAGGVAGRQADIDAGADRAADDLVADVRASADAVDRIVTTLPDAAWDAISITARGVEEDSRAVVFSRWREVAVHHGDLGLTATPPSLPPTLVAEWLPTELSKLSGRCDSAALLTWILGRGPAPELQPW